MGAFVVASVQPLTIARCFKTSVSDRFDGLLSGWVFIVWYWFYELSLARWLLVLGVSSQSLFPNRRMVILFGAKPVIWELGVSIWAPCGTIWALGGTLGDLGSNRKDTWGSRIGF